MKLVHWGFLWKLHRTILWNWDFILPIRAFIPLRKGRLAPHSNQKAFGFVIDVGFVCVFCFLTNLCSWWTLSFKISLLLNWELFQIFFYLFFKTVHSWLRKLINIIYNQGDVVMWYLQLWDNEHLTVIPKHQTAACRKPPSIQLEIDSSFLNIWVNQSDNERCITNCKAKEISATQI